MQVSIDELPLFKSSSGQFWPILGMLQSLRVPFIIELYCGNTKPKSAVEFLADFVTEMSMLEEKGIQHGNRRYI